jgi:hypothetical protein
MLLKPLRHESRVVPKRQVVDLRSQLPTKRWKFGGKTPVSLIYFFSARDSLSRQISEKIPHHIYCMLDPPVVRTGILSCDVRYEFLIAVRIAIQNETNLTLLFSLSVFLGSQKHSEFERHIESRQFCFPIQLCSRNIVNSDPAFGDDLEYLAHAHLARIIYLLSAAGDIATIMDREYDRSKELPILPIERAIDEYAQLILAAHRRLRGSHGLCMSVLRGTATARWRRSVTASLFLNETAALASFHLANSAINLLPCKRSSVF